eukprot:TRINITY_DN5756_c0_g2_i1.p1 TRINITY_DN5756_c0_g2~~TRINITY_DN5756_c0_g2_i1.p1  ORF type:complete len:364 (-),score=63.48 TRINITY_DN5756_c0_g2_i1:489-1580(-)
MAGPKVSCIRSALASRSGNASKLAVRPIVAQVTPTMGAPQLPSPWLMAPRPDVRSTPVVQLDENLHAKLEGEHESGSIKDRAVKYCVHGMVSRGALLPGGTLALCTSGSAGVALLLAQREMLAAGISFNVKIFMPRAYVERPIPQKIVASPGVSFQEGVALGDAAGPASCLCPFDGDFVQTLAYMKEQAALHGWAILDQHYDYGGVLAHESTSKELMGQLPSLTDVVCATGTGATAAGLRRFLPQHVTVHSRPAVSGTLDGCTDVRRYKNFCEPELLAGYESEFFCPEKAVKNQERLLTEHDIFSGPSSGACFELAKKIAQQRPDATVAFICADGRLAGPNKAGWGQPPKEVLVNNKVVLTIE